VSNFLFRTEESIRDQVGITPQLASLLSTSSLNGTLYFERKLETRLSIVFCCAARSLVDFSYEFYNKKG
jgi:hypothetical protein